MLLLLLTPFLFVCESNSFKILVVIPKFGYSHMNFMGQIADTLVDAGHDVVTLQPLLSEHIVSNGTTKSRLIQMASSAELIELVRAHHNGATKRNIWMDNPRNPLKILGFVPTLKRISYKAVIELLSDKKLLQQLEDEKFHVAITEHFDFIGFGVLEAINLKNIVGVHTIGSVMEPTSFAIGQPVLPSFIPASGGVTGEFSDICTRALNLIFTFCSWMFQYTIANSAEQAMKEKLGPNITPIWDTISHMSWLLVNSEPFLDFDRPTLHKIVHVGGLGVHEPKPLSEVKRWNRVLNLRRRNVLVSFGSVARTATMPDELKKTIVNTIKSLQLTRKGPQLAMAIQEAMHTPRRTFERSSQIYLQNLLNASPKELVSGKSSEYAIESEPGRADYSTVIELGGINYHPNITFIWKYDQLDDPAVTGVDNLILSKWTPQTDLLADDRLTVFVTHCGAGSMIESATFGKPLVVIPLFADQIRNSKLIEKFGLGVVVDKAHLLHGSVFNESLNAVMNDPRYRTAADRMRSLLSQRPFTPKQKLVRTVELAAQFGDLQQFKVAGRKLGIVVYYNLDLITILCSIFALIISLMFYLFYLMVRQCLPSKKIKIQ